MAEYIEREALLEDLQAAVENGGMGGMVASALKRYVKRAPAADVVEVVRCEDCKHAWIHPCGYVYCHRDGRNAYEMTFNLDSFCSYGERKEGADND